MSDLCVAVRLFATGTLPSSSTRPRNGVGFVFFFHSDWSKTNGAKFASRDSVYCRFCRQLSKDARVSCLERDHRFGALCCAMTV